VNYCRKEGRKAGRQAGRQAGWLAVLLSYVGCLARFDIFGSWRFRSLFDLISMQLEFQILSFMKICSLRV
jgi:hypothetical protein